ncbi:MAG TPA: gamma-glutamyl-gamma-aminobutyrate hydrolase family protein [Thermoanaerobaculia bacterium]|nr:gamma-glutamyl-gamma-aminobutyrate hydrolase family protein [Thermoanaerobaculia bacterium]
MNPPPDLLGPIVVSCSNPEKVKTYAAALRAAGAPEERIRTVFAGEAGVADAVARAAGLVLCGGSDVDPARYGEAALPDARLDVEPLRDGFEWDLLTAARAARTPTFGVCRGFQTINVFLGGSLYQDLELQRPTSVDHEVYPPLDVIAHTVRSEPSELPLAGLLASAPEVAVNSRHHQGIKRLAPSLTATAHAPDGLIEAFALPPSEGWWLAAVEWHPENLVESHPLQRALWEEFVTAAARTPLAG